MANEAASPVAGISARESEVLAALGEHLTNAEIGIRLFISVRTVESHVSSLLRKLQVDDRRALAAVSANPSSGAAGAGNAPAAVAALPSPLTPFVGRAAERAALTRALREHRLVTAVGPGGVGKTRLALSVAAEVGDRFADGVWYVNLVPVTDPVMIAPAIADALGLGESQRRSAADSVLGWLAGRETLLVLDNCEHLLDGVVVLLERLLAGSRLRPGDEKRVAAVCRGLDGMALAIELAAARYASLGLDGLEAGLADRLRLLTGGPRIDDRHRSLRSALDWSHDLLPESDRAVLRRISVFAGPFAVGAAVTVLAGWPPVPARAVATILAGLPDQSLLLATPDPGGTAYRTLETIRQYGADRLEDADESAEAHARHLAWCLAESAELQAAARAPTGAWRAAFDRVADELRAALTWAASTAERGPEAYRLSIGLAELSFTRGMPGETVLANQADELTVFGGDGDDVLDADGLSAGTTLLTEFGGGNPFVEGAHTTDGNDTLIGTPGDDGLFGGTGQNRYEGRGGNDTILDQ
jgi:predicted ATPase/DNA-binding CsgD family transcriptional regulator